MLKKIFFAKVCFHNSLQSAIVLSSKSNALENMKIKENETVIIRILNEEKIFIFSCLLQKNEKSSINKVKLPIWVKSCLDPKKISFKHLYSEVFLIQPSLLKDPFPLNIEVKILDILYKNQNVEENLLYFLVIQLSKQVKKKFI